MPVFTPPPTGPPTVAVIGTMDTKGHEHAFVCDVIHRAGGATIVIDTGIMSGPRGITPTYTAADVARSAGTTLEAVRGLGSRGPAVETMEMGLEALLRQLFELGDIHGVIALGGAEGTVLGTRAMRALPLGFPKLMVSAIASGRRQFGTYMGASDVAIMHSVVDVAGLNDISRAVFGNAAGGILGMARYYQEHHQDKADEPVVAVSMLGNTQKAYDNLEPLLIAAGLQPIPFHANGVGGAAMESLILDGQAVAVIDMTLNEVTNQLMDGVTAGNDERLRAAGRRGIPQVIVPGCVDFFTYGAIGTLPAHYLNRNLYRHNPNFTLVRATAEEMAGFGREIADRLSASRGPTIVFWPRRGLSLEDRPGGQFEDRAADQAFLDALRAGLPPTIRIQEIDSHISDVELAAEVVKAVISYLNPVPANA